MSLWGIIINFKDHMLFSFESDNALSYRVFLVHQWFKKNSSHFQNIEWPPEATDINVIYNFNNLWERTY